jgi:hypothetical protein
LAEAQACVATLQSNRTTSKRLLFFLALSLHIFIWVLRPLPFMSALAPLSHPYIVTILVTRTHVFSLFPLSSLPACRLISLFPLFVHLFTCNSVCRHYAMLFSFISLIGRSCVSLCTLGALLSLTLPSFSIWCVLYTSSPFVSLCSHPL